MNNADRPAYPVSHLEAKWEPGLTKRETAVLMAMQGLCANPDYTRYTSEKFAEYALERADATLAAMENPND